MKPFSERREWWIEFTDNPSDDKECYKRYVSGTPMNTAFPNHEIIHVVEYSAIDALKQEKDDCRLSLIAMKASVEALSAENISIKQENEELRREIDIRAKPTVEKLRRQLSDAQKEIEKFKTMSSLEHHLECHEKWRLEKKYLEQKLADAQREIERLKNAR